MDRGTFIDGINVTGTPEQHAPTQIMVKWGINVLKEAHGAKFCLGWMRWTFDYRLTVDQHGMRMEVWNLKNDTHEPLNPEYARLMASHAGPDCGWASTCLYD